MLARTRRRRRVDPLAGLRASLTAYIPMGNMGGLPDRYFTRGVPGLSWVETLTRSGAVPQVPGAGGILGTRIEEGTTNLASSNPEFATNTTGWGAAGTNTIVRTTALLAPLPYADFGTATTPTTGAVCTYQDNAFLATFNITLTAAAHSSSIYIYIPSTYDGTQLVWSFGGFTGATGTVSVNADMTKTDQWQRVKVPNVTIAAGDLAGTMALSEAGTPTAGKSVTVTAMQIEAKTYVTSYAASTRTTSLIRMSPLPLNNTQGSVFVWAKPTWASTTVSVVAIRRWFTSDVRPGTNASAVTDNGGFAEGPREADGRRFCEGTVAATFSAEDGSTRVTRWDAAKLYASFNGGALAGTDRVCTLSA